MARVEFVVEEAGCASCAQRVREALAPLGVVEEVVIDEQADEAAVALAAGDDVTEAAVADALARASEGAGHAYRVRAGSWTAARA